MHEHLSRLLAEVVPPDHDHLAVPARRVDVRRSGADCDDEDLRVAEELVGEPQSGSGDHGRIRPAWSSRVEDDLDRGDHPGPDAIAQEIKRPGRLDALWDGDDRPWRELEPKRRRGPRQEGRRRRRRRPQVGAA